MYGDKIMKIFTASTIAAIGFAYIILSFCGFPNVVMPRWLVGILFALKGIELFLITLAEDE